MKRRREKGKETEEGEGEGKGEAERRGRGRELVVNKFQTLLSKITGSPLVNKLKVLINPNISLSFPDSLPGPIYTQGIERGIVIVNFLARDRSDSAH